jgi:hypothetical protein
MMVVCSATADSLGGRSAHREVRGEGLAPEVEVLGGINAQDQGLARAPVDCLEPVCRTQSAQIKSKTVYSEEMCDCLSLSTHHDAGYTGSTQTRLY